MPFENAACQEFRVICFQRHFLFFFHGDAGAQRGERTPGIATHVATHVVIHVAERVAGHVVMVVATCGPRCYISVISFAVACYNLLFRVL